MLAFLRDLDAVADGKMAVTVWLSHEESRPWTRSWNLMARSCALNSRKGLGDTELAGLH